MSSFSLNPKTILLPLSNSASTLSPLPFLLLSRLHFKTLTCCASRDDLRWLREEQRWLREEQRWLREEQRWACERDSLLAETRALKLLVQSLEPRVGGLLDALAEKNLIPQSGEAVVGPMLLEEGVVSAPRGEVVEKEERKMLRMGSEGAEVREMQEALQKLGFYSGEEDMEFSSFSSGTHHAVQTWQATLGAREDGIMTAEHLELLLTAQEAETNHPTRIAYWKESAPTGSEKKSANRVAVSSTSEITEAEKKAVKEDGKTEVEVSHNRVFLLGENRWEDPSRLGCQDKVVGDTATSCLSCRGEGTMLCAECDGTGEPNVEPQFMEWIDEKLKCPYCVGLGYTVCDVCGGKAID